MSRSVGTQRSYHQACNIAYALDVIGERWTLLLIRDLIVGPKRFGELQDSLEGIGTNLLSTRLKELESSGVLEKQDPPGGGKRLFYALTPYGRELEAVLRCLLRWGSMLPDERRSRDDRHRPQLDLAALKLLYRPELEPDLSGVVQLDVEGSLLRLAVGPVGLTFGVQEAITPDCGISGDRQALERLVLGKVELPQLLSEESVVVSGDMEFALKWSSCFRNL